MIHAIYPAAEEQDQPHGTAYDHGLQRLMVVGDWFDTDTSLNGGFEFLLHLSVFFYLFLYSLVIAGVVILRKRQPETDRPYRAWGHPWSTWLCLLAWLLIGLYQAVFEIEAAAYAGIMVAISWPAYLVLVRRGSE